jgi:hypothetical protein
MYNVKQQIYLYFDRTQKSHLCSFLRSFVKQHFNESVEEIFRKFIDDESYYIEMGSSRYEFIKEFLLEDCFIKDTKMFISACRRYYEQKNLQKPFLEKQKNFEREKRKFLQNVKMSKEPSTSKQKFYYEKLCSRYNIEKKNADKMSKLDMKNEIERILNEHS